MSKIRVYQVAKELNVSSKDIITKLESLKIDIHNHMSTLEDNEVALVNKMFKKADGQAAPAAKADAPAPKVEAPAAKVEAPAAKVEAPAAKVEAPAAKVEAPAAKVEAPAEKTEEHDKKKPSWTVGTPKVNRPKRKSDYNKNSRPTKPNTPENKPAETKPVEQSKPVQQPAEQATPVVEEKVVVQPAKPKIDYRIASQPGYKRSQPYNKSNNTTTRPATTTPKVAAQPSKPGEPKPDYRIASQPGYKRSQPGGSRPSTSTNTSRPSTNTSRPNTNTSRPSAGKPSDAPVLETKTNTKKNKKKKNIRPEYNKNASLEDKFSKKQKGKKRRKEVKAVDNSQYYNAEGLLMVPELVTVGRFADMLGESAADVIMSLMAAGIMANLNQEIPFETVELIALEYEIECQLLIPVDEAEVIVEKYFEIAEDEERIVRPPVVTVMGHVDHGKTSLLDAIRETAVTVKEAGGITQHIGASEAVINGQRIVFLDTPGHEAFTTLRARGAQVTDIAVLVVAADDGVMPQTIEAIDHAKAAGVPIIVAINKIDKPGNNPDQVKKELSEHGILVEDWGGDVISVEVSALKNINIESLLEMIVLQSEVLELRANPEKTALGTIIDAKVDKGRGIVATLLVQDGTLEIGDSIVCGSAYGRVRAMYNHVGKRIKTAGPSTGVEITGLSEIPVAGDRFFVAEDDRVARKIAEKKSVSERSTSLKDTPQHVTLEDIFERIQAGKVKEIKIVLKADVQGSLEALKTSLLNVSTEEVTVNVIHSSVGTITESDVLLASASDAIIIGFNVRPSLIVEGLAIREGVELKTYRIIYEAINDVADALIGMLDPEFKEEVLGTIEVRQLIKVPNFGTIAGGYVMSGKITRSAEFRLIREGIVVHEGKISSLRRFKDDVKEVAKGYECGIGFENYNDMKENDIIEAFHMVEIKRKK